MLRRRIRKWYLCWRYHICPVHNTLQVPGGYAGYWTCQTCVNENHGKNTSREQVDHLARVRAQQRIARDWRKPPPDPPTPPVGGCFV